MRIVTLAILWKKSERPYNTLLNSVTSHQRSDSDDALLSANEVEITFFTRIESQTSCEIGRLLAHQESYVIIIVNGSEQTYDYRSQLFYCVSPIL